MTIRITEIHRNGGFRLVSVTEIHRPRGFGQSTSVIDSKPDNGSSNEHMGALDSLFWNTQQPPIAEMSDEELAHAYFAQP